MIERETSNTFHLASKYEPAGDQPAAIAELVDGVKGGEKLKFYLERPEQVKHLQSLM